MGLEIIGEQFRALRLQALHFPESTFDLMFGNNLFFAFLIATILPVLTGDRESQILYQLRQAVQGDDGLLVASLDGTTHLVSGQANGADPVAIRAVAHRTSLQGGPIGFYTGNLSILYAV